MSTYQDQVTYVVILERRNGTLHEERYRTPEEAVRRELQNHREGLMAWIEIER